MPIPKELKSVVLLPFLASPLTGIAQDTIVAADGTGTFKTVQEAVNAAPPLGSTAKLHLIEIKPGTYREKLLVPKNKSAMKLRGSDPTKTILTYNDSAEAVDVTGKKKGTFDSASIVIEAGDFAAENITFENSFGKGSQAVALQFAGDRGVFRHCRFLGWQDTLLLKSGRSFFEECEIQGATDFIFGAGTAWFEKCELRCMGPGFITAPSTPREKPFGFVFSNGAITPVGEGWKTYLGRPWRPDGNVVFLRTTMSASVQPSGWDNWGNPANEQTARFSESQSQGPGARPAERAAWSKQLTPLEASAITVQHVLSDWDPNTVLSAERIATLPPVERQKWEEYLERSTTHLHSDKTALAEELKIAGLAAPLTAPSGPDFKLKSSLPSVWFGTPEAHRLAETVLSFQIPSGGWSKHVAFEKGPRAAGMHWSSQVSGNDSWHYVGTFDNRSTTEELRLLAGVFGATHREEFRRSFLKGLDYIFDAQFPNGGWPQVYPLEGGYHDHVTFNDDAMVHILQLLQDIARREPGYSFVDEERRNRATSALETGIGCLVKAQVSQNGRKTVWCAQHEPLTLAIAPARRIEPPALSGGESVGIVRFLMGISNPSPSLIHAIEDAASWFERTKISGLRETKKEGRTHYEKDPESSQLYWARFSDALTNQPIFPGGQTGCIYHSFEEMAGANRVAYDFYVSTPTELLSKDLPKWRAKNKR